MSEYESNRYKEHSGIDEHYFEVCSDITSYIFDTTEHCIAYRSIEQIDGGGLTIGVGWPPAQEIIDARDSLIYRTNSVIWHLSQLQRTINEQAEILLEAARLEPLDRSPHVVDPALFAVAYAFDDLIFNTVSMFDYTAKYLCRIEFPSVKKFQLDWRKLSKATILQHLEHKQLEGLINSITTEWFRELDRLRSEVIHNKASVGGLNYSYHESDTGLQPKVTFKLPARTSELMSFFGGSKDFTLFFGAKGITLQSLLYVREVLILLKKYEYRCLHDPHMPNKMMSRFS